MPNPHPSRDIRGEIAEAVRSFDFQDPRNRGDLDDLSKITTIEDVEVFEDVIIFEGRKFEGAINVYVSLEYGDRDDGITSSDSFPGSFKGHMDENDNPVIDTVSIDTSAFYE